MQLTTEQKDEIKVRFENTETVEELAQLLSWIYALKIPNKFKKTNIVIEAKHLNYYAYKKLNRYIQFSIKKKSGGEREIFAPKYKLKTIQKCINEILNAIFIPHSAITGFVPGKSIVDNAKRHVGKQFVFNTDLKDFFPNVSFRRIKTVLGLHPFNLSENYENNSNDEKVVDKGRGHLSFLIANICCENGFLPQGAPTSPTLTNLVCQRLDKKLHRYAKTINATYSRYADDITFSANKPIFDENFKKTLIDVIEVQEKFKINYEKERLQNGGERQTVTGIVVNRKTNVDRKYLKDVRFWLMCWKKFGTDATKHKFLHQFPDKKGFVRYKGNTPPFQNYLHGKILFFGMVRGKNDALYLKFLCEFEKLRNPNFDAIIKENKKTATKPNLDLNNILNIWQNKGFGEAMKNL